MNSTSPSLAISIRNLRLNYGLKTILQGIDLDVPYGQVVGYIGPNGAGKSTTIKTMLGLVTTYSGTIELFGKDIAKGDLSFKGRIGYVPETAEMYDALTVREYLVFIAELYGIEKARADRKAKSLIHLFDLDVMYDARLSSLSKGMRQKVLLISSLLHNPDLLFLDEPLSGLDANSVMVVKDVLAELALHGKTIFYSSHIMDVVEKISDRILLLRSGQIVADDTFEALKEKLHEDSLEQIFNQITGFEEHVAIAREFVATVQEV